MSQIFCPTTCTDQIGVLDFDVCNPNWNEGGIEYIYLTNIGYPLIATEGDPAGIRAELLSRISNTSVNVDAIRVLTVMADKPAPTKTEIEMSAKRRIVTGKTHTLNVKIDETGDDNYEFLRRLECGSQFLMWWVGGKYMFGGEDAFIDGQPVSITIDDIHPQSDKELNTFDGLITWESKFHPNRMLNPLA
jgi:hypothetical protein